MVLKLAPCKQDLVRNKFKSQLQANELETSVQNRLVRLDFISIIKVAREFMHPVFLNRGKQ